ncbi:MAG: D-alanine--D-alanine ligase [Enterococcaceae bacterium]|jgi:D-alanine-D-alanine ligase|nr:D-alanine--D-alanine ligase [Enterococcaceae bacterium]
MDVVVLAGGLSDERDVSMSSGSQIANALQENGHRALLLDVYFGVPDAADFSSAYKKYGEDEYSYDVPDHAPDLAALRVENNNQKALIGRNVIAICQDADVVFLALHGGIGENGQLQALLDIYDIRYTGSEYGPAYLAMDKAVTKEVLEFNGIKTAPWIALEPGEEYPLQVDFPVVVKPSNNGSSIGVSMVDNREELVAALDGVQEFRSTILIEERIPGREFSVGVMEGQALPIIEIRPKKGFYDYANKYQAGSTEEITPAPLDEELTKKMQDLAVRAHRALRLGDYSRVDFMMREDGEMFCIEANTLPGMTPTSLLPQEALAIGISYNELCERLLQSALEKEI